MRRSAPSPFSLRRAGGSAKRSAPPLRHQKRVGGAPMDRAEEKAGLKDVGEQALMRGLDTAFPFFRLGLSLV